MTAPTQHVEEHAITGKALVAKAKELIREGNARRLIIKNQEGDTLLEVPLTVGVMGAVLEPVYVALGAIAALAAHYRIAVERHDAPVKPEVHFHCREDV